MNIKQKIIEQTNILLTINMIEKQLKNINDYLKITKIFYKVCNTNICNKYSTSIEDLINCITEYLKYNCNNEKIKNMLDNLK